MDTGPHCPVGSRIRPGPALQGEPGRKAPSSRVLSFQVTPVRMGVGSRHLQLTIQFFITESTCLYIHLTLYHLVANFFKELFLCRPFFKKSSLNFLLRYCSYFMFWCLFGFFWPWGMWDPSSLTRGGTHSPCTGRRSLNHWTRREVSGYALLKIPADFLSGYCFSMRKTKYKGP